MAKYIVKRILGMIPILFIISVICFGILKAMPGDEISAYLGASSKLTPAQKEQLRENLGLNDPYPVQYVKWLGRTLSGNLGESVSYKMPVSELIGEFIWNTFLVNAVSLILAILIAIPVGIKSAVKKYGWFDNFWNVFSLVGISIPTFFFGLLLIFFVAIPLNLPMNGMRTAIQAALGYPNIFAEIADVALHMILPVFILTMSSLASLVRYVRNSMIDVINQDYVRTARSKGLSEKVVIYKHAFRNSLIPLVTLLGLYIPTLFSGAVILETVFLWPGLGQLIYTSTINRDTAVVMAAFMFSSILILFGNLLSDVLYAVVDPRIKVD